MRPWVHAGTLNAVRPRVHLNVVGDFYVEDRCCTQCGVPFSEAPALFGGEDEDQCFVARQPETPEELAAMFRALEAADLRCIRYAGKDDSILHRLRATGNADVCDH